MQIQLFIDTNIYLNFHHFSNDDLEELSKLLVLIENQKVVLYLPEQVIKEYHRNRDAKLADALKSFIQLKLNSQFPQFCKNFEEYDTLRKIIKEYSREKDALIQKVKHAIDTNSLKADDLIANLFQRANNIKSDRSIIEKAKLRYDCGDPPGKDKSLGDAINWESLLDKAKTKFDLYFIADDKDWNSKLDQNAFNSFLQKEWLKVKGTQVNYYKSLSDFFKDKFPDIKLATELEKDLLIGQLVTSPNFRRSRTTLYKLAMFDTFSSEQVNQYISASINNEQIRWISEDEDINLILHEFAIKYRDRIESSLLAEFYSKIPILDSTKRQLFSIPSEVPPPPPPPSR